MDNNRERETLIDWIQVLSSWIIETERKCNQISFKAIEAHIKSLNEVLASMKRGAR
jgi:hypothetical protein